MSSDHPFDNQLNKAFEGFEPEVTPNWTQFEQSLSPASAETQQSSGSTSALNTWSIAAAVVAGGALMWVAKPAVQEWLTTEGLATSNAVEDAVSESADFQAAWQEFTRPEPSFEGDVLNPEGEKALSALEEGLGSSAIDEDTPSEGELDLASATEDSQVSQQGSEKATLGTSSAWVQPDDNAASSEVEVRERILAELPFDASIREACEGVEVAFELTGLDRNMSFLWNFGDGHFSSDPAPRHVFNRPGTYDITLSIRPPGDGMIRTRTIQNMITVLPKPEAAFNWAFPLAANGNKVQVELLDETPNATAGQWVVDGQSTRSSYIQLDVPGSYPVNLVASNTHGCLDDASHVIQIGDRHGLLAQARFSPDGDGHYDTFLPHGLKDMKDRWEMVIVDREGGEVFRTTSVTKPWNGKLADGSLAKDRSVYQWTVRCASEEHGVRLFTDRIRVER